MNREHRELTTTMQLGASAACVFPILCPVREYDWIEHWTCEVIHTLSGFAELDCVFTTRLPADSPTDVWIVSRYEPASAIEFIRQNPSRVMRYSIICEADDGTSSRWRWTQRITALNDAGDAQLRTMNPAEFTTQMAALETMLNHYLRTGTMLRRDANRTD